MKTDDEKTDDEKYGELIAIAKKRGLTPEKLAVVIILGMDLVEATVQMTKAVITKVEERGNNRNN